ncbi:Trafficking protein particle complex subunit 6B [Balamuthia mandrillaris]
MADFEWRPRLRDYAGEADECALEREPTEDHPLLHKPKHSPQAHTSSASASSSNASPIFASSTASTNGLSGSFDPLGASSPSLPSSSVIDPLGASSPSPSFDDPLMGPSSSSSTTKTNGFIDPLMSGGSSSSAASSSSSSAAFAVEKKAKQVDAGEDDASYYRQLLEESVMPWSLRKKDILQTYTTDEEVGIQVKFMETESKAALPSDKTKQRLEQLEESEEKQEKEFLKMSQKDYITHIENLHEMLSAAWKKEERVKSLKIVIQAAKLLLDNSVIKFYPSKWVLITEILDTFGDLVFKRILNRASVRDATSGNKVPLAENFDAKDVSETARETCRNWFFKIASIRELLPRIYVELALIKSYSFLSANPYPDIINRLCLMMRGIGDPLVASYALCYLARKAKEVSPTFRDHLFLSFDDHLYNMKTAFGRPYFVKEITEKHRFTMASYVHLFSPAVEWLLQCIAGDGQLATFEETLNKYTTSQPHSLVLYHIISSFQPEFISQKALQIAQLIKESDGETYPKFKLYNALGTCVNLAPPKEEDRLALLKEVWKVVTKIKDPKDYVSVVDVWIDYPIKLLTAREVNTLLGDLVKHMKVDKAYENLMAPLQSIVGKVLAEYHDFASLFAMSNFMPILDMFSGSTKVEVNKSVLAAFSRHQPISSAQDPVLINSMFQVAKVVHDSVNTLTFADEVRQISVLIADFIHKIDFGQEVVKHLDFLVDCRRAFANLDAVKSHMVLAACNLAMRTLSLVHGRHTKKTAAFVRACIAYSFITIPSMDDVFARLHLYLLAAQVAFMNQALPQADSLLKAAITLIQEVPSSIEDEYSTTRRKNTDPMLLSVIQHFSAVLVVAPGHPEHGPFYLIKGLVKVVQDREWEATTGYKSYALLALLSMFCAHYQDKLPYHINGLESNDVLYGDDPAARKELEMIIDKLIELILQQLAALKKTNTATAKREQVALALALFEHTICLAELNAKSATLAANLFNLAKKAETEGIGGSGEKGEKGEEEEEEEDSGRAALIRQEIGSSLRRSLVALRNKASTNMFARELYRKLQPSS